MECGKIISWQTGRTLKRTLSLRWNDEARRLYARTTRINRSNWITHLIRHEQTPMKASSKSMYKVIAKRTAFSTHFVGSESQIFPQNCLMRLFYGTPEGTFSVLFLSCTHKLLTRFDNIITRLNYFLSRSNKLFILFKQDNNSFKRLIMSFKQVIYLV